MKSKIKEGQFQVIDSFVIRKRNEFYLIGEMKEGKVDEQWFVNVPLNGQPRYQRLNEAEAYMKSMGLEYTHKYKYNARVSYLSYTSSGNNKNLFDMHGYDYLVTFGNGYDNDTLDLKNIRYIISSPDAPQQKFSLISDKDTLTFDTDQLLKKLTAKYGNNHITVPEEEMSTSANSGFLESRLELRSLSIHSENDSMKFNFLTGHIFIRMKK